MDIAIVADKTAAELRPGDGYTAYNGGFVLHKGYFFELNLIERYAICLQKPATSVDLPASTAKECTYNTHRALSCQHSLKAASRNKVLSIIPPC
jgi:hypothetical protein